MIFHNFRFLFNHKKPPSVKVVMDFLLISIKVADEECSFATFIVILTRENWQR